MSDGTITVRIEGLPGVSLLVKNGQTADPRNQHAKRMKEITSRRKKTDEDLVELAEAEYLGSLYLRDGKPSIPPKCLMACLRSGAKKTKNGKVVQEAVYIDDEPFIEYSGTKKPDAMFGDDRFVHTDIVRVGQAKVVRTRPQFPDWALEFEITYDEELVNHRDIAIWLTTAGRLGLCDYRPRHGRFEVTKFDVQKT